MSEKRQMQKENLVEGERFAQMYREGVTPWEIGRPQKAVVEWVERGMFGGSVVDLGCGTGENAFYLARHGCEVVGLDLVESPLEKARAKAREMGLGCSFFAEDMLEMRGEYPVFDQALDSGLFHNFSDEGRVRYVQNVAHLVREGGKFFLLAFTPRTAGERGPRRVSEEEIREVFSVGWEVVEIREVCFETTDESWEVFAWAVVLLRGKSEARE